MRVLIVTHMALPHVGGLEVVVDYEIRALIAEGHQVTLVTSNGTGSAQTPKYPKLVTIIRVPAWHVLERRFRLPYPIFSPRLTTILWREAAHADVIHVHGFMFMSSPIAALIGRLRGKKIILTDHGGIQQFDSRLKSVLARIGAETVGRFTALCSDRLVTFNTRIVRTLERLTGRPGQCLFLPNPVDHELFRPVSAVERRHLRAGLGWSSDRPKVLFVGRLIQEKGVSILVDCISPEYDLVFCGSGDPSILGPLPRDGIEYLPPRPQAEVVKLYQAADVVVAPSKPREGFPLVIQEALSCGTKVVLGYDEGFEPYRILAGLMFCEATASDVRRAIVASLADKPTPPATDALGELCPTFSVWVRRLYGDPVVRGIPTIAAAISRD